ncbi:MAG: DUF2723 domain-containing protein [Flavobacteriales bacterium]|nr:DUF2723 domain-containing protein [Flavobacteriales bacterium]
MDQFKKYNTYVGSLVFIIATTVYCMTIEPTASFWDCGEYIASAYKLQVGHPPGGPFFQLLGRMFSLFAFGDVTKVAMMINILSALCSSFTILFLFWSITHIGRKLQTTEAEVTQGNMLAILGSGIVGALAYTFSDSFWFSAVEGEVYAMSSLFTALMFWLVLKWEEHADDERSDKWILLIAYVIGLSIGVHLLSLLVIPAIGIVYYFKRYETTRNGLIAAFIISFIVLIVIQYGIIPGIIWLASKFELFFVNTVGLPFNSGIIVYTALIIGGIVAGLRWSKKVNNRIVHILLLSFSFILIGYSSYALIVIRSSANPPMDENNPEQVFSLLSYLQREQYGDRPLGYGQYYNAPLKTGVDSKTKKSRSYKDGSPVHSKNEKTGKYYVSDDRVQTIPQYNERFNTPFPRMYSSQATHIRAYKSVAEIKGKSVQITHPNGEREIKKKPTFWENLRFFRKYQIDHMYMRYFFWNFVGKQNDLQAGIPDPGKGNWITGIDFLDDSRLGPQGNLPSELANNKAKNKFYGLPLLLGIAGLIFLFGRSWKDGVAVFLLFFFTGLAIVIYLNQYPYQPRERDYAYVGSFYAFSIWIGLGVYWLFDVLKKYTNPVISSVAATVICLLLVPTIMAKEGWDDHDRSDTYTARDFAYNYLHSCAPNAILFTNGDNDTFPLWYLQDVEGIRTDVRVVNLSLLNTDWYIDQMKRRAYDSAPTPFSLTKDKYIQGTRDFLLYYDKKWKGYMDIDLVMEFIASDQRKHKLETRGGKWINYLPTKRIKIPVEREVVLSNGTVNPKDEHLMLDHIEWDIKKNHLTKNNMMIVDLLATNNWKRPVYFAITVGNSSYLNLQHYFQLEGLAYRLVPIKTNNPDGQLGRIDTDIMFDNMMNKFKWGNISDPNIYLNEQNLRMTMNFRSNFTRLAEALIAEGKIDKAIEVTDRCFELMPNESIPYNLFVMPLATIYYSVDQFDKGNDIVQILADKYEEELEYYFSLDVSDLKNEGQSMQYAMSIMQRLTKITEQYKQTEMHDMLQARFDRLEAVYMKRVNSINPNPQFPS